MLAKFKAWNASLASAFTKKSQADINEEQITQDESRVPRQGVETSDALFNQIVDSIERNDHMLLIGPRGCGKSYAVRRAINIGEQALNNEKSSLLVPGAQIMAQGNKEFPRDYFFEPEFEFTQGGSSAQDNEISVNLRQPPLFACAKKIGNTSKIDFEKVESKDSIRPDLITRYTAKFEVDGRIVERFVFFLDEINRFNDGVLDSLLLLLEDSCVIYQGRTVEIPAVVIATMNPPGYDVSARSLSPPLMSRFSNVTHLYTAGMETLVKLILPQELKLSKEEQAIMRIELFAAATLAFWGAYDEKRPCAAYLSPETSNFLEQLYKTGGEALQQDLNYVQSASNYGPDARAARDWILAAHREMKTNQVSLLDAALNTLVQSVANKLVLNFNPEANPEKMNELVKILGRLTEIIFDRQQSGYTDVVHTVIYEQLRK